MAYQLSASKLKIYHRCPQAYYFRYERGMRQATFFGSTSLGTTLHQALAQIYQHWAHYQQQKLPDLAWIEHCWQQFSGNLSQSQVEEGKQILFNYHQQFIAPLKVLERPVGVEGKIQAPLNVENVEFTIVGRYDRLDYLGDDGLELIDYKSTKEVKLPDPEDVDVQVGLYYLALIPEHEQRLKRLSLLFLRTCEKISFEVTPEHKEQVEEMIHKLALRLRADQEWEPNPGKQCDRCTYARYCAAVHPEPEPLPDTAKPCQSMQLALGL